MNRLYVLGDSISIHYGPFLQRYLQGVMVYSRKGMEAGVEANADNYDANGGDSSMVMSFLQDRARAGGIAADVLLLNCGLHDVKTTPATGAKQVSLDAYRANLERIVAIVREMGPKLVWVRTTPADEKVHNAHMAAFHRFAADVVAYNAAADAVMSGAGVPMIDLHKFTMDQGGELFCDHIHFVEPVRQKQAAFIAGWLVGLGVASR